MVKFGKSSISMREFIIKGGLGLSSIILGANSYVCRSYWEKTGRRAFFPHPDVRHAMEKN